ncbi:MAG: PIG-L family deacetylase, partial [archaeon]
MIKNLLIVAHPDDEIMFASKFLLENRDTTKVIIATTPRQSRKTEFLKLMNYIGVKKYEIWGFIDNGFVPPTEDFKFEHIDSDISFDEKVKKELKNN